MASIFAFSMITSASIANGQPVHGRTDIEAYGCVIYFLFLAEFCMRLDIFGFDSMGTGVPFNFPFPRFYTIDFSNILIFPSPTQSGTVPLFRYVQYEDGDIRTRPISFQYTIRDLGRLTNDGYWFSGIAGYVWPSQPPAPPGAIPLFHYYNPAFQDHAYTGKRADDLWRTIGYEFRGNVGFGMPTSTEGQMMSRLSSYTYGSHHKFSSIHINEIDQFSSVKEDFCKPGYSPPC